MNSNDKYKPLIGTKLYCHHLKGLDPIEIIDVDDSKNHPIVIQDSIHNSITINGKLSILDTYPCISTTPYDPINMTGKFTPFNADELLKELSQPKIGELCVFYDYYPIDLNQNRIIVSKLLLIHSDDHINNNDLRYMTNDNVNYRYCIPFDQFDFNTMDRKK